ncbi:acyl-CoA dehydrogenase family protein [Streptomyces sp. NPDC055078]
MDFELDADQQALVEATANLLKRHPVKGPGGGELRRAMAEMGLLGLPFSEDDGGAGAGPAEVYAVATELGRHLAREPYAETVVLAGGVVAAAGSPEQRSTLLGGISQGHTVLALAHQEPGRPWSWEPDGTWARQEDADIWRLTGVKSPVLGGADSDTFVVSAKEAAPDAVRLFVVAADAPGVTVRRTSTIDGRGAAELELAGAPGMPLGTAQDHTQALHEATVYAQAALCAEAVGLMDAVLAMTVEHLRTRRQFGVPLASFQALAHRVADLYVALELARSMSAFATMSLVDGARDGVIAARARLRVARSSRLIGQEAIQLHGGIGLTTEHPVSHHVSRLVAIDRTLGDADDALDVLAGALNQHPFIEVGK